MLLIARKLHSLDSEGAADLARLDSPMTRVGGLQVSSKLGGGARKLRGGGAIKKFPTATPVTQFESRPHAQISETIEGAHDLAFLF